MSVTPDYSELDRLLDATALSPSPAEAQGIYCGLLAAAPVGTSDDAVRTRWLDELLRSDAGTGGRDANPEPASALAAVGPADAAAETDPDADPNAGPNTDSKIGDEARCRELLATVAEQTRGELAGASLSFSLLLPPEDAPLSARALALHGWARGFLFGLGVWGLDPARLSADAREVFDDLTEITHMDLNDLDADETNEQALAEIIEFMRVAALLLYEERSPTETH